MLDHIFCTTTLAKDNINMLLGENLPSPFILRLQGELIKYVNIC